MTIKMKRIAKQMETQRPRRGKGRERGTMIRSRGGRRKRIMRPRRERRRRIGSQLIKRKQRSRHFWWLTNYWRVLGFFPNCASMHSYRPWQHGLPREYHETMSNEVLPTQIAPWQDCPTFSCNSASVKDSKDPYPQCWGNPPNQLRFMGMIIGFW